MKKAAQATPNQRLSCEREKRGWSQLEVADYLGTTPVNVSRWERGLTAPSPYFRRKLCELFGKPAKELGLVGSPDEQVLAGVFPQQAAATPLAPGTAPLWSVPYRRNPFFTGREDVLLRLQEMLSASGTAALTQTLAISGLGGIGKTQIALEYAYRHRSDYRAVFWVKADSREALAADLAVIADLLHRPVAHEQDRRRAVAVVRRWLNEQRGWLLILDNADDLEMVSEFLPTEGTGHTILTTRAQATGQIAQGITLEQMGPEEGTFFLLRRAKLLGVEASLDTASYADWSRARAIAQLLGGLPLALDQAGAYLEETGCSLAGYLERYQHRRVALLQRRGMLSAAHPEPVATTWSLSLERVGEIHPAAGELLRACAFLHPDAIPEELLREGAAALGPVLAPVAADPVELDLAIEALRRYSLVRRAPETQTLTIHRLVQAVLTDQLDEQSQRLWAERAVRAVCQVFPEVEFAAWQRCQRCFPHALICAALIEHWGMAFPAAAQLLNRAGNYLRESGQYQEAEPLLKRALATYEQAAEPEHPEVASCLNDLATLYWNQGKYAQAEPLFRRALVIREAAQGPEHPAVATSLNDLALLYWDQGKYAQAETLFERALAIREKTRGPEHPDTAETLNNLGILSLYQGNYTEAERVLQRSLAIWEQTLGPDHPKVAYSLNNLAYLCYLQGRYAQAEPLYLRALAIRERAFGTEHDEVAYTLGNLALVYTDQGRHAQAEPLFERALAIHERVLGPEHPFVALTLHRLAKLSYVQGHYAQAEPLLARSLAIRELALGTNHPDVASSLDALALLALAQGQYRAAEQRCRQALAIREQALGPEHREVAASLNTLAQIFLAQGHYAQAEPLLQRVLSIRERTLGPAHPEVANCLEFYAHVLRRKGRLDEAATLEARARAVRAASPAAQ